MTIIMEKIYTVAHTHWDFEWYFTRQEAKIQFIFHMDEVLDALEKNTLDYYTLDGQMAIIHDYLNVVPENKDRIKKFVQAGRLFIGPWFTQIDEMTTSGEAAVRNLKLGITESYELGSTMKIGYLPDSFGQSQDMPKIYNGFGIKHAIFWRGLPKEYQARYFYWSSNDGSKVLTANIKNGYYVGGDLINDNNFEQLFKNISTYTDSHTHLLPVGGDQRAVDFNLKDRIKLANNETKYKNIKFIESNYPLFFKSLESEPLKEIMGEFIEPTDSKIHRGIYSSRYDLKQLYDKLERILTYKLEPMFVMAKNYGIPVKQGLLDSLWMVVARGQAHDSAGGCNSDKTNRDIKQRAIVGLEEAQSCVDYLLRKLSSSINNNINNELFLWNPLPFSISKVHTIKLSTRNPYFILEDSNKNKIEFDIITQTREDSAVLRRDVNKMNNEFYYNTTIAIHCSIPSMMWVKYSVIEGEVKNLVQQRDDANISDDKCIENSFYKIQFQNGTFNIYDKKQNVWINDFIGVEDGGDEGDTYDYSPAYHDLILNLRFNDITSFNVKQNQLLSLFTVDGYWKIPGSLSDRKDKVLNNLIYYKLNLKIYKNSRDIDIKLTINNSALDHRMRLLINTNVRSDYSISDTQFGIIKRPIEEKHLSDWKEIGYKEEPTSLRPMIHFCNLHDSTYSYTFLSKGSKEFQVINDEQQKLGITIFRGVGYLGRPDSLRRPGDASGLERKYVSTPESQLIGHVTFDGTLVINNGFDPQDVQMNYLVNTQDNLYYQTQEINRYTTPTQFFPINLLNNMHEEDSPLEVKDLLVVMSSIYPTKDGAGFEIRLYNPKDTSIEKPGKFIMSRNCSISKVNLEGNILEEVYTENNILYLEAFKSGEIRTYCIYPNNKEKN